MTTDMMYDPVAVGARRGWGGEQYPSELVPEEAGLPVCGLPAVL